MRVLVTGGAGFIGSHLVDRLVENGREVAVLDNLDRQVHGEGASFPVNIERHVLSGDVEFFHGDVRDLNAVEEALEGVTHVAHLAATVGVGQSMYEPRYYTSTNVDGQGVLMEAIAADADRYERFIVASSMSIYGEGRYRCEGHGALAPPPREESRLRAGDWDLVCPECGRELESVRTTEEKPLQYSSVYAITKKTQEELALCFGRAYDLPTIALRFFNVYGSRQALSNPYTGVAAIFMSRLKNGKSPLIFEDGLQSRDFIHVSDIADAVVTSLEAERNVSGPFNVCTGCPITIREVAEVLAKRMGLAIDPEIVGKYRAGDIRHCVGDPTRAQEAFGFRANTAFEAGLDELLHWSEEQTATDCVGDSLEQLEKQGLVR